ncbi:MAG: PEGA domain-containing protein [Gammaproteobacteria bacterium]|nr:PEGA domain-containing protein [Gammaproteobacteria bacterium]
MKKLIFLLFCLSIFSCAAPRTAVQAGDQSGTVIFKVQPGSSIVYVDGKKVGQANEYDGLAAVLALPSGTHQVVVENHGKACQKTIYVSDTQEVVSCNLE